MRQTKESLWLRGFREEDSVLCAGTRVPRNITSPAAQSHWVPHESPSPNLAEDRSFIQDFLSAWNPRPHSKQTASNLGVESTGWPHVTHCPGKLSKHRQKPMSQPSG